MEANPCFIHRSFETGSKHNYVVPTTRPYHDSDLFCPTVIPIFVSFTDFVINKPNLISISLPQTQILF